MIPKIGDSSDKPFLSPKPAPVSKLQYVIERVEKGYYITPSEAMLLVDRLKIYYGEFATEFLNNIIVRANEI